MPDMPTLDTVLVVDDDPVTRYVTARVLRAAGFDVQEASTGGQALASLSSRISAVVLDVHLPDIDGFEVCRVIRNRPDVATWLPIIHLSAAYVEDEDKVAGLNAGADAYLIHPAEPAVLVATLRAMIRARKAEDELRRSDGRFRAIYDQAPSGIALIDADDNFVDANPAMTAMLRRSREQVIGQAIGDFLVRQTAGGGRSEPTRLAASGSLQLHEIRTVQVDGATRHLEWSVSPEIEPGLRIGIAVDITDRAHFETRQQELLEREQAARAAAEQHSKRKDDFIAVLSHELRTPLNSIVGWLHILKMQLHTPAILEKALGAIERSVTAQTRIISDILDVSRISSGKLRLHPEWSNPFDLLNESIEALRDSIDQKKLTVECHIRGEHFLASLDPTRFQQIFWNLMTNAVKFSFPGGLIRIELALEPDRLSLVVQDFGRGIREEFLGELFHRFSQGDAPGKRSDAGLGLGLSIVRHLVDLHGGVVRAHSAGIDKGTTMRVELPVEIEHRTDTRTALISAEDSGHGGQSLAGLDVLVVEDNIDSSEMLLVVLSDGGATVRVASDYDSALIALGERWPAVLISDIGLPGMDGYDLIRYVRRAEASGSQPALLSIAFTALSRPQDRMKAIESGFDLHLSKPLEPHLLLLALGSGNTRLA
jgi:PAS domain S-box-containing protein